MDEIDLQICQILLLNSRTPFRNIAKRLNISVQAIHRRVQNLFDNGAIKKYYVLPSNRIYDFLYVYVYGQSKENITEDVKEKLSRNEFTHWIFTFSGKKLYVGGVLRNFEEVDEFTNFVKTVGNINKPKVGIIDPQETSYSSFTKKSKEPKIALKPVEMRIIGSLYNDARKSQANIAEELGISTKTINRHLDYMIKENLIDLSIVWIPISTGDHFSFLHMQLDGNIERNVAMKKLLDKYSPRIVFFMPFSNLPNELIAITWHPTLSNVNELEQQLIKEEFITNTEVNLVYGAGNYDTWRDTKLFNDIKNLKRKK